MWFGEAWELGQIELKHSRLYPNPRIMLFCSTWCFNLQLDHIMLGESHEFPSLSVLFSLPYPGICIQEGLRECHSTLDANISKDTYNPSNVTCAATNRTQIEWTKGGRWEFAPFRSAFAASKFRLSGKSGLECFSLTPVNYAKSLCNCIIENSEWIVPHKHIRQNWMPCRDGSCRFPQQPLFNCVLIMASDGRLKAETPFQVLSKLEKLI